MEILRLASKVGKGWLALLVSERLVPRTHIPDYILRAIAFACHPSVDETALKQMGEFRVKKEKDLAEVLPPLAESESLSPADFLSAFHEAAPTDALSLFYNYLEEFRGDDSP